MTQPLNNNSLITENMGLVHACANRFRGKGVDYEDLFQAGCVGLVKAAAGFDESLGYRFSTYAVPAILGEIRRIFRDGGAVKIGRAAKEKARVLLSVREELADSLSREPTVSEIAQKAKMDVFTVSELLCASLPTVSLTGEDDDSDRDIPVDAPDEKLSEKIDLAGALESLDENERRIIDCRYYKGLTQSVTAQKLGMTQVQVSRREKAILGKLRKYMDGE